ncbi:MAG: GNAT family N-acetyltransferase [Ruminococcus sp.]|nr:GNAT family N-acetyltransferase [Ruminococcus sp.]
MDNIRKAKTSDASRIAEMIVINYRINFYPFFRNDEFYFGELNVIDTAKDYTEDSEELENTSVYDDGIVKGMIRISGDEIVKLYVEPQFQSCGVGAALLEYAVRECGCRWLWALEYNTRGIAFYRSHGFELTGEKMIEDEWVPLVKLSLDSGK